MSSWAGGISQDKIQVSELTQLQRVCDSNGSFTVNEMTSKLYYHSTNKNSDYAKQLTNLKIHIELVGINVRIYRL